MISGDGWWWPTVEVIAVIWLVGVGARLARVPTAARHGAAGGGGVASRSPRCSPPAGSAACCPTARCSARRATCSAAPGTRSGNRCRPPPATVELSFLTALTVGVTALIVDILIAVCRAPALVALPLLCVYSVPASINLDMLPWFAFAGPALLYALLLVATGLQGRRIRRRRRRRAGGRRRRARRGHDRDRPARGVGHHHGRHRRPAAAQRRHRREHRRRALAVRLARGQPDPRRAGRHAAGQRAARARLPAHRRPAEVDVRARAGRSTRSPAASCRARRRRPTRSR